MKNTKRNYESLFIVDTTLTDEQIDSIVTKYSTVVADQGGEVQAVGKWDKRRLAYEIKGRREGIYILMYFTGEATVFKELDRLFRISDDVLRHIIVRVEPQHIDTSRIEQQAQASTEQKAVEAAVEEQPEVTTPEATEEAQEVETPEETAEVAPEAVAEEAPEVTSEEVTSEEVTAEAPVVEEAADTEA